MIAGTLVFVVFVSFMLFQMSANFPDLVPSGLNPTNLQKITEPVPPSATAPQSCNAAVLCLNLLAVPVANFFTGAWNIMSGFFSIVASVFTFDVPAFSEMGPAGIMLRLLIVIPMSIAIGLMLFFVIKSVVPFVGGNAE